MDDARRLRSRVELPPPPSRESGTPARLARVTTASRSDRAFTPVIAAYVFGTEVEGGSATFTDGTDAERFLVAPLNGALSQGSFLPAGWGDYRWSGRRAANEPPPGTLAVYLTGYCPNNSPIPGVLVTATKGTDTETGTTADNGRVVLQTHGTGSYSITLEKSGFNTRTFANWFIDGSSTLTTYMLPSTITFTILARTSGPVPFPGVSITLYGTSMSDVIGTGTTGSDGISIITLSRPTDRDTIPFAGGTFEPPAGHGTVGGNIIIGTQYLLCDVVAGNAICDHAEGLVPWPTSPWPGYFPPSILYEDDLGSCNLDYIVLGDRYYGSYQRTSYAGDPNGQLITVGVQLTSAGVDQSQHAMVLTRSNGTLEHAIQPVAVTSSGPGFSATSPFEDLPFPPIWEWPTSFSISGSI